MDQYYYETGYIDEGYYAYIAEASATLDGAVTATMTAEIAVTSGYYIPDYIETGYFAEGTTHEASASLDTSITIDAVASATKPFAVALDVVATSSTTNSRIRETLVDISGAMTANIQVFASLSGDIDLYVQFAAATQAERSRDTDVTLSNLVNLSLQAAITRTVNSDLTAQIATSVTAATTRTFDSSIAAVFATSADVIISVDSEAELASTATLSAQAERVRYILASADLNSLFTQTANAISYVPNDYSPRPINWVTEDLTTFDSNVKKYGTHSLRFNSTTSLPAFIQSDNPTDYFNIDADEDFALEFWWRYDFGDLTVNSTIFIYNPSFYIENFYNSGFQQNSLILNFYGNTIETSRLNADTFYHISVLRLNGTVYFRLNQVSAGSISDSRAINDDNDYIEFRATANPVKSFYIDEFALRVGEATVNGYTQAPVNTDPTTTLMLTHFDNNFEDDLSGFVLDFNAALSSNFTQTASGGLIADITVLEAGSFNLNVDVERITQGTITLVTSALYSAEGGYLLDLAADIDAFATTINVINKIGNTLVDIPMTVSLSADVNEIVQLSSNLEFTATAAAQGVLEAVASSDLSSAFTQSVAAQRFRDVDSAFITNATIVADGDEIIQLSSNLGSAFTQTSNGIINVESSADLSSNVALTADNVRVRYFDAEFDAFAANLTSGSKIGDYLVDISMNTTLAIDANVKTGIAIAFDASTQISADLDRYRTTSTNLDSVFTQQSAGIISVDGASSLDTSTTVQAQPVKIVDAEITISGVLGFDTTAKVNRAGEIDLDTAATLAVDAVVIRGSVIDLNSFVNLQAQQTTIRQGNASIDAAFSAEVAGRIITLLQELEYTIPSETREFSVLKETREYTIEQEAREYTV